MTDPDLPPTSRYVGVPVRTYVTADGRTLAHFARRLLPDPDTLSTIGQEVVRDGDRADLMAHRTLGDQEQWWRIADANAVFWPEDLFAEPGRRLRITLPRGL
ncbi:MAG: LysM domain-containing protein [Planctomycetes bacterium]|nr:LysM domain-containing protein [Planctomycetota bacterium]